MNIQERVCVSMCCNFYEKLIKKIQKKKTYIKDYKGL